MNDQRPFSLLPFHFFLLTVAASLALLTAGSCRGESGSDGTEPAAGLIAFVSDRDGNPEIYLMDAFGGSLKNLTQSPASDTNPVWSPDGTRIAYTSWAASEGALSQCEIWVMKADGTGKKRLITIADVGAEDGGPQPVWSPDGTKIGVEWPGKETTYTYMMNTDGTGEPKRFIGWDLAWAPNGRVAAYVTERDGNFDIHLMTADGSRETRLTDDPLWEYEPTWSPDGSRIVFYAVSEDAEDTYVMAADGTGRKKIGTGWAPTWSPDGERIAYMRDGEIWVAHADGTGQRKLAQGTLFTWSPKGDQIGFLISPDEPDLHDICVVNGDGSGLTNLTKTAASDTSPAWSPDGGQIAFVSWRDGNAEIYVTNPDGTDQVNLTNNPADDTAPAWQPPIQ